MGPIDPEVLKEFLLRRALNGPHKELAEALSEKNTYEKIGKNLVAQYKNLPPNYPSKRTLLKIGSEVTKIYSTHADKKGVDRKAISEIFDVAPESVSRARSQPNSLNILVRPKQVEIGC